MNDEDEIEDADHDKEENSDEEEKDGAEDDAADDKSDAKSKKDKDSEDDDSDEEDSDDDDSKPLTRADLRKILAESAKDRSKNRNGAAERVSKKRDLSDTQRASARKDDARLDSIEKAQQQLARNEEKRQFGYENKLSPDEVDVVFRITKRPTAKSLNDPVIRGALNGHREAQRAKANIPGSGGAGRPARAADRAKEEANLTPSERRDRFADRRRELLANRQGGRG